MATREPSVELLQLTLDAVTRFNGVIAHASRYLGHPANTVKGRYHKALDKGMKPSREDWDDDLSVITKDEQIASLKTQIKQMRADRLDQNFIKEKLYKLRDSDIQVPDWLLKSPSNRNVTGVPTLFASDWHWGEVVEQSQINNVNEYNLSIARRRANMMISATVDILKNRFHNPRYEGIVFALGGDMVSGDIHEELSATNEIEIMPTVIDLFGILCWCIETLADEFSNVFVPCVTGNHGRNTYKIRNKGRTYTSFDWLTYHFLAKRFEMDSRVKFLIPDGADAYYTVYNHKYLLTHGDQFRGGDGIIGALFPILRGDSKKRTRNAQINYEYDTMILGHWHQLIQLQRCIVNGSLKGYDEYAYTNNFPFEPPRQALWITHPEHGITFSTPVNVDKQPKKISRGWVSWKE